MERTFAPLPSPTVPSSSTVVSSNFAPSRRKQVDSAAAAVTAAIQCNGFVGSPVEAVPLHQDPNPSNLSVHLGVHNELVAIISEKIIGLLVRTKS